MKKILVTEDSATMRGLIVSTLEAMERFEVVEANNGFEALRALPREKVDLIITDINMPDINGLELVNFCRSNPLYLQIPVTPPGKPKLVGADASHAWISIFVPDFGWVDLDPTNNLQVNESYITVAGGRMIRGTWLR